jgi:hypothetical protein
VRPQRTARSAPWLAFCALLAAAPAGAQSGRFALRGRVVEAGLDRGIAQATVQLGDSARAITDARGEFEIRRIRPGRYSLTVEALGFHTVRTAILITGDATGTIELEPDPIPLDTLAVRPARFDLRGRLVAREERYGVP